MADAKRADIVGRRIVGLRLNAHDDGRGQRTYDPEITLNNGAILSFVVHETEGDYGIDPHLVGGRPDPPRGPGMTANEARRRLDLLEDALRAVLRRAGFIGREVEPTGPDLVSIAESYADSVPAVECGQNECSEMAEPDSTFCAAHRWREGPTAR